MLRREYLPRRAGTYFSKSSRFLALSLGFAVTGCSADVSRFDYPMFGLTESGNRVASAPIPRESVLGYQSAPSTAPAPTSPYREYAGSYPRGASEPGRGYAGYAPSTSTGYGAVPAQPSYGQSTYNQTTYDQSRRPPSSYQTAATQPYRQAPSAQDYERRPVTAYPPQSRHQETSVALTPPTSGVGHEISRPRSAPPAAPVAEDKKAEPQTAKQRGGNSRVVEVQPGDTLFSLAQRHRASISELMSINGLASPSIRPGQKILLPQAPSAIAASVRQGPAPEQQTARVAAVAEPAPAPEKDPPRSTAPIEPLPVAAVEVPAIAPRTDGAAESGETYAIRRGESLYSIAVRHGISLNELMRINGISDPHKVKAGTVLKLPGRQAPTQVASARESQIPSDPKPAAPEKAASDPAPVGAGSPSDPVIINAPKTVASLENARTMTDAAPALPVTQPEAAQSEAKAAEPAGSKEGTSEKAIGKFRWPARGKVIAGFGKQSDGSYSEGIKLSVPVGTEVHAAENGVVVFAGDELKDYGNLVLLRHDDGWITAYAHNSELNVKRGDRVRRGQVIAKAGNTGSADKPQLHFELRKGSSPVDPIPHLESL